MDYFENHPLNRSYNIDSALNSLWDFYRKNFIVLFLVSLVMSLITQYASTFVDFKQLQSVTDPEEMLAKLKDYLWPMVLVTLLNLLFYCVLQYYVLYSPADGKRKIFTLAARSLRYFIPFLIIMVLFAFFGSILLVMGLVAVIIGILFSILYLATIYLFILPVMMAGQANIANTISTTFRLVHRNFWPNLGWTAALILIILVISVILSGLVLLPFTGSFLKVFSNPDDATPLLDLAGNPIYIFLTAAVNAIAFPLFPVFGAILYFNVTRLERRDSMTDKETETIVEEKVKVEDLYAKPLPDKSDEDTPEKNESDKG